MRNINFTFLLAILMSMVVSSAFAYDAKIDGIYYNFSSGNATVTFYSSYSYDNVKAYKGSIVIPESVTYNGNTYSVTSIGKSAFNGCSGLTSVTIPYSVTSIGDYAFSGCSGLKKVIVPDIAAWCEITFSGLSSNPLYYAKHLYSDADTEITDLVIPEGVTSISDYAFLNCSGLTSINVENGNSKYDSRDNCNAIIESSSNILIVGCKNTVIPNSVTSIGYNAFYGCSGLTSITIPSSVTSIDTGAFSDCSGLTSIEIPNSVTKIGYMTFYGCSGLTSITIPNSVTELGTNAFYNCSQLRNVTLNSNSIVSTNRKSDTSLKIIFGNLVATYVLGDNITSIGNNAFYGCSGLLSITIPNSVTNIGNYAFSGCSALTNVKVPVTDCSAFCNNTVVGLIASKMGKSVCLIDKGGNEIKEYIIPEEVTSIGSSAFHNCSGLTSITIPNSVTTIGSSAFSGCSGLTSITIPNSVTTIGSSAFSGCSGLTSITIPNSVTTIGGSAFSGCSGLSITIGDNITNVYSSSSTNPSFPSSAKIYTKHKTKTLFSLWNGKYNNIYEQETSKSLAPPYLSCPSNTQTSYTIEINNFYSEYTYLLNGEKVTSSSIEVKNMYPDYSIDHYVDIIFNEMSYRYEKSFSTRSISPSVKAIDITASSATIVGNYTTGDANVISEKLIINKVEYEGNEQFVKGLNPNTTYSIRYEIVVAYGSNQKKTYDTNYWSGYTYKDRTFSTDALTLTTQQPKVVSLGNVIVSAEANIDDEEENVGFEWRRTDWTDDFASNTGTANMVEGTMEGYIRNLNTEKLWKFRPYYLSDSGTYYYGDWVGLDPTNTSYFEPTVHTYAKIEVKGNTALVKGYALGGSDKITVQGFKYWKKASANNRAASDIPSDAMTIEAKGTVMEVSLTDLEYASSYEYVAFATTSEGDTFYGEIKTFETGESPVTPGDANGDGLVNVTDIVEIVNDILGHPSAKFNKAAADVNGDGVVNVTDIVSVVNIILSSNARELTNRAAATNNLKLSGGSIKLRNAENYTAAQFDIHLTDGSTVNYLSLNSTSDHQMTWKMVDANTCRVIVYSLSNAPFRTAKDELFNVTLSGNATICNELLVNVDGMVTGINEMQFDKSVDVYDLRGNKIRSNTTDLNGLQKGVYIVNGKKVVVK